MPYGSADKNPRGDTPLRGRIQGIPRASTPDFSSYESPQHMLPRQSYLQVNRNLDFGNQARATKLLTWKENLRKPAK